jgi:RimJ/RimL family protein N-acetyltransferase
MQSVYLKEPSLEDQDAFLAMTRSSQVLHHPWVKAPLSAQEFVDYVKRYQQPTQKSFWVCYEYNIVGVFNFSEIVKGCFQNAYLGFYAAKEFAGKGLMQAGLKLVLKEAFTQLDLHRVEANIQPQNERSLRLVKKAGFREEGFSPHYLKIDGEWRDHIRYAMTIEDWEGR